MLRVTERMGQMSVSANLARLSFDLLSRQSQASTGLRVAKASDDPVAARAIVEVDDARTALDQYRRNVDRSLGDLNIADDALGAGTSILEDAQALGLQLANDTVSSEQRADAVATVDGILSRLVAAGNTKGIDGYIFAGHQTDQAAFDTAGTYLGDAGQKQVAIGENQTTRVGITGDEIFRPSGGEDAFAALAALRAALVADDRAGIATAAARLDTARQQVTDAHARIGGQMDLLLRQEEVLSDQQFRLDERRSDLAEVNGVDAIAELVKAQGALESAVRVSGQMLNTLTLVGQL